MSRPVRRAFMMLEAAVALLIVGLTAGAALELYGAGTRAAAREPGLLVAMALAQDRLAAVRLAAPEQLGRLPDSLTRGRFAEPFAGYRWRTSVTRTVDADLYNLRVEVTWNDGTFALSSRIYAPSMGSTR